MFKIAILVSIFGTLLSPMAWSQGAKSTDFLVAEEKKTEPEFFKWIENYDEALEESKRTGKPIFLIFRCVP